MNAPVPANQHKEIERYEFNYARNAQYVRKQKARGKNPAGLQSPASIVISSV
jgi:hypothetical protein